MTLDTQVKLGAPSSSPGDSMGAVRKGWDTPSLLFPSLSFLSLFRFCPSASQGWVLCALSPPSLPAFLCLCSACLLGASLPVLCLCCVSPCFPVVVCRWLSMFPPSFPPPACVCVLKPPNFPRSYDLIHHHQFPRELQIAQNQDLLGLMCTRIPDLFTPTNFRKISTFCDA